MTTSTPKNDPSAISKIGKEWFDQFKSILIKEELSKLPTIILDGGYWRDLLTFSWDYRTLAGPKIIQEYLSKKDALKVSQISNLKIESDPILIEATPDHTWIQSFFTFETAIARGRGLFRLVQDANKEWKALTIYTGIEELKGHEEPLYGRRPLGVEHGNHAGRISWKTRRETEQEYTNREPEVLIIGAGHSGLMIAARLRQLKVDALIIDKNDRVGDNWRKRYEFLVLHDPVWYDHLPYIPFPANWPIFTPKDKLADWLEQYSKSMELNVWMKSTVGSASYDPASGIWIVDITRTDKGSRVIKPKHIILATGHSGEPNIPKFIGQEQFQGTVCHSSQHTTGRNFTGKKAVVVGCCNSGHDIAQDFVEQGADTTIVQRSSTYIISSKSLLNISLQGLFEENGPPTDDADLLASSLPLKVGEVLSPYGVEAAAQADKAILDGLTKVGFKTNEGIGRGGIFMTYFKRGGGYYIDVGASSLIASGKIKIKQGYNIDRFTQDGLVFEDGSTLKADIVVLATGYKNMKTTAEKILGKEASRMNEVWGVDEEGEIKTMWRPTGHPSLWVMGGNLGLCRFHSKRLALQIKARLESIAPMDTY